MGIPGERLGATLKATGECHWLLWAPQVQEAAVRIVGTGEREIPMERDQSGYHRASADGIKEGTRYFYRVHGEKEFPDPASQYQPEGVHGPSAVVSDDFQWGDGGWFGIPLRDYIIYELHVGTFSREGTFEGVIPHLAELKELGVTAIELMPVAQFPGSRNWGYDGVGMFAAQNTYGGPEGLKKLVNAAHRLGFAVILDVVYNHLGPEGNYLGQFGPYFTNTYNTPWGAALNFDGPESNHVRRFFIENALYWQTELHVDALRLDAVHAIRDNSAVPFLRQLHQETAQRALELNRRFHLISETDLNAPRFIRPEVMGGFGHDAQWADDFHHCLHSLLTGEDRGYYQDYTGGIEQFARVWRDGYAFTGEYSPYRKAYHGDSTENTSLRQFVVCSQNHDQVGNRMTGDRLTATLEVQALKLAAAAVLLSPFTPLLFMGEEYGEQAPFQYFVSHGDADLVEAVRKGRREEFSSFAWSGEVPDPQSVETFDRCRLTRNREGEHGVLWAFYQELIRLRKQYPHFTGAERSHVQVHARTDSRVLAVRYSLPAARDLLLVLAFGKEAVSYPTPDGDWREVLNSAEEKGREQGNLKCRTIAPLSVLLLEAV